MIYNDVRENKNKGFSLVELIVVIAIMAVMVAVLAPSLLQYVERSRAQKDDSAMGEVTNAIMLALADQDVYDEVLAYTVKGNFSSYVDSNVDSSNKADLTVYTKADNSEFNFNADARLADEEMYKFAGAMRGVTITFYPETNTNESKFVLANGVVNHLKNGTEAASSYINGLPKGTMTFGGMDTKAATVEAGAHNYLYNRTRATIGDSINLTSQTYRNSPYTVFIRMGSTGGNQATAQDAIAVYGQWGGTNLDLSTVYNEGLKVAAADLT